MARYIELGTAKYATRTIIANHLVIAAAAAIPRPAETLTDAELLGMFGLTHIDTPHRYYAGLVAA